MKLSIVMYHYVRDLRHSRYPEIKGLDLPLFRRQLEFFQSRFKAVTMEQVIAAIREGETLPDNALLLTFDDGYMDHYACALPLLEEFGFQGTFFIPGKTFTTHQLLDVNKIHYILASADIGKLLPDVLSRLDFYRGQEFDYPSNEELFAVHAVANRFDSKEIRFVKAVLQAPVPEKVRNRISSDLFTKYVGISEEQLAYELYMNPDQIRTMKRHGMFIGVHGWDHYWLDSLPKAEMKADIAKALEIMDPFIDRDAWAIAYPYGRSNSAVLDYVAEQGACVGVTIEPRPTRIGEDSPLALPRMDCNDFPPKSERYREYNEQGICPEM